MQLIDSEGKGQVQCKEVALRELKATTGTLAQEILQLLAEHPEGLHASSIAKRLKQHEQKIYYHTRKLLKAGIVSIHHTDDSRGGTAKVLVLQAPAFAVRLREFEQLARVAATPQEQLTYLAPFIENGRLNCRIIVGSPDPHGPEAARARDANYAIDLGLFLGTFLTARAQPAVQLDTELRDWNQNLIIIGGPVVNKAAERINAKSPTRYDLERKAFIIAGKVFDSENAGMIAKMPNPYAKGRWILHIAGKRHTGTRAAILALLTQFDKVCASRQQVIVEGIDADSDGVIDSARILRLPAAPAARQRKR
jgi:DNA-binding transcriptional ArsR family regulator